MPRRKPALALVLALACAASGAALAQHNYPNRPIRMIVVFPPGGGTDFMARVVAQNLSERLGQQVIVENRGGANGITGLQALMTQPADGYTICAATAGPLAVNPSMYKSLPYDPLKDFTYLGLTVDFPLLLLTHPALPVKNTRELIALAKARPNELTFASSGVGNADHLAFELFRSMAKIQALHVPYKGSGPTAIALRSGEVQAMFSSIPPTLTHVRAGKMRALAVGSLKRIPGLTEFPTVAESGVPGYEAYSWGGIIGPRGMPQDIVAKLNREINEVLKTNSAVERLLANGTVPRPGTAQDFVALEKAEVKKWGDVIKMAGIKPE